MTTAQLQTINLKIQDAKTEGYASIWLYPDLFEAYAKACQKQGKKFICPRSGLTVNKQQPSNVGYTSTTN